MSWAEEYQAGTWRGVPFSTRSNDQTGGRRGPTHEFPGRDKPLFEDLGRRAETFELEVFVWGDDYLERKRALVSALRQRGAGTLVHPYEGTLQVAALEWSSRESTDEQGIVFFTITFGEAGGDYAAPTADTAAQAEAIGADVLAAAPLGFANRFDVSAMPALVEEAGGGLVERALTRIAIVGGLQGGAGLALQSFQGRIETIRGNVVALVRSPLDLGLQFAAAIGAVRDLAGAPLAQIAGLSGLLDFAGTIGRVIGSTPARDRQRANQDAFVDLVTTAAAAELVRAIAAAEFDSYQQAVEVRDRAAEQLEACILGAADMGRSEVTRTLQALLAAMVTDITARGGTLARIYRYTPAATEPALVIAARLYGNDATLPARAADIAVRNRLVHPGFVAGGRAIEVLEASGG